MKLNDEIRCSNEKELQTILRDLEYAGFHAVTGAPHNMDPLVVKIIGVPETVYLLQVWARTYTRVFHCGTLKEAEELVADLFQEQNEYELAEICEGYPGEWEPVKRIERKGGEA